MENGDQNYADSGAAADNSCGCEGCEQAWKESWALEKIEAAEADCGGLSIGMCIDLLQDQSVDVLCFELNRDAAALLVVSAQGLKLRLAKYEAERRVDEAKDDLERLKQDLYTKIRSAQDGPRYEHPLCQNVPDDDGPEDRPRDDDCAACRR
jgi:hypothetical protein